MRRQHLEQIFRHEDEGAGSGLRILETFAD